ncbi:L-asparaginase [Kibdelosporangium banguiense]|uniref:L-asparaginase n=1 Tax=Kibdelosporangium banguiense TaxID=1365924 RepID=A0ABS4U091_9PSEU|nr:asparaginase [Kibdelosporangium banguiense]MBP2330070.1 L-asparaginase [Kibdelosporangium banguiense]
MKHVLLVATGDTMAYMQDAVATGAELLKAVADVPGVEVTAEDVMAEPSWDTTPGTMLALARRARKALLDDGFEGVVVTHGVDTLEETAFLTDLMAGPAVDRGGIVFTGATRYFDEPGSDGPDNLVAAITAAPETAGLGALVCFDRQLHAARWATLATATSFASDPVLGHVSRAGEVTITATPPARQPDADGIPETDVALIKTYPGMPAEMLTAAADAGARGIVLEGTGDGNVPVELFIPIGELTGWDIPVVIASRAGGAASTGLAGKVGAISAQGLRPAHARVALMVALATGGVDAVRSWFARL